MFFVMPFSLCFGPCYLCSGAGQPGLHGVRSTATLISTLEHPERGRNRETCVYWGRVCHRDAGRPVRAVQLNPGSQKHRPAIGRMCRVCREQPWKSLRLEHREGNARGYGGCVLYSASCRAAIGCYMPNTACVLLVNVPRHWTPSKELGMLPRNLHYDRPRRAARTADSFITKIRPYLTLSVLCSV